MERGRDRVGELAETRLIRKESIASSPPPGSAPILYVAVGLPRDIEAGEKYVRFVLPCGHLSDQGVRDVLITRDQPNGGSNGEVVEHFDSLFVF